MKKIAGKIAMILILIMLAGMFTSCFTRWSIGLMESDNSFLQFIGFICFLPCLGLDLLTWLVQAALTQGSFNFRGVYEDDMAFLTALIASLPETERASAQEQINSVPEQQLASVAKTVRALCALPQADRIFLLEALRSLPEKERAFLTETASSLSDEEIAALADDLSSIPASEMARQVNILRKNPSSDWGYREYAAERFAGR